MNGRGILSDRLAEIITGGRLFFGLGGYLKNRMNPGDVRKTLKARMACKEENFLRILKKGVFEYKKSPYLWLFRISRWSFEDVVGSVSRLGLEETLRALQADGIYIKVEEFKGKKSLVRHGKELCVREADFDNPFVAGCYERRSGGTRSAGTRVACDFDFLSQTAPYRGLIADIWGLYNVPHVLVRPALPYGTAMIYMLHLSKFGVYPVRWFSLVDEKKVRVSFKSRACISYILHLGRMLGGRFPYPEFLPPERMAEIAVFLRSTVQTHKRCTVFSNVSTAVRISLCAREKGIDLGGVLFQGCGEPLTETRKKEIESSGAAYILYYAFTELGLAGSICRDPSAIDDVHLFNDFFEMTAYKRNITGIDVDAFLFTSLLPSSPKILLNVESGDYGNIDTRRCGCPYDDLGYSKHIHHVRSFEKLTSEGVTFYGTDLGRIIEEVLPLRFGGSSVDYQLVEKEGKDGIAHVEIRINPAVGEVDEDKVAAVFFNELKKGNDSQRVMAEIWSRMGSVKIRREFPVVTEAGKLYPLHILSGRQR